MADILHVGIDLGTSRSAISASNGERFVVDSFVGWPADMVAKKILKRTVLIGHDAVSNRTMLDLHRPLERGLLKEGSEKDVEAVRELLKHLLGLVGVGGNGKVSASNVRAVVGVPAAALRTNKQYLRNSMKGIVDSLLIVSEPFAVAYGLDALLHTMIIDIGAGTTDFCVMKGRYPTEEDQRTLTIAGDSIDTQLLKLIEERYPQANVTVYMVREWKEKFSFVGDAPHRALVNAPIHKQSIALAGCRYPGHTELLAARAGRTRYAHDYAMYFDSPSLRVSLLTVHEPLWSAIRRVNGEDIAALTKLTAREYARFYGAQPRIGVAAMNPHAGEGGKFGDEEEEILRGVEIAKRAGVDASGPWPADTLFLAAREGKYDVVVAMYHDQGLIPIKMLAFASSVNVTIGLPYLRVSVDHGTAFDIAGKGIADAAPMRYAIEWAARHAEKFTP